MKFNKKTIIIMASAIALVIIVGGFWLWPKQAKAASKNLTLTNATVTRDDMTVTLSGTGTVGPIQRYDIIGMKNGQILSSPFEVGAQVKKGDLLYQFDDQDVKIQIEKTKNSMSKFMNGCT